MDGLYILLLILLGLYLLVGPGMGIAAFQGGRDITRELLRLRKEIARLGEELAKAQRELEELRVSPPAGQQQERAEDSGAVETATPPAGTPAPEAEVKATRAEEVRRRAPEPRPLASVLPVSDRPRTTLQTLEPAHALPRWLDLLLENIKHNWVVWLGAVTVALGGAFLVKYSIERGWVGPLARVLAGGLLGLALLLTAEKLRRHPLALALDYLPVGLSASGVFLLFASGYAAYGLYGFIGPLAGFLLLAAIAYLALLLSLLHGQLLALIGLLGAFAVPALVSTDHPRAWSFFTYLTVVTLSALPLMRIRGWWPSGWAALSGSFLWTLLWFSAHWQPQDPLSPALHLLAVTGGYLFYRRGGRSFALWSWPRGFAPLSGGERLAWGAGFYGGLLSFALVRMDGYEAVSLAALFLLTVLLLVAARREDALDGLALVAALSPLALLATWHLPQILPPEVAPWQGDGPALGLLPIVPPELSGFLLVSGLFALLFGLAGFLLLKGTRRPWIWGGLSASLPLVLLALAYWRLEDFAVDLGWTAAALLLAGLLSGAARLVAREEGRGGDLVLAAYIAAAFAAIALGAAMALRETWLTVALAAELPVLAWLTLKLELPPLRPVAFAFAVAVLQRLVFNPYVLEYGAEGLSGLPWILYGYGLPAAAFAWAATRFRRQEDDQLVLLLEAGALLFVGFLATFTVRQLVAGSLTAEDFDFAERSLDTLVWLGLGLACRWLAERDPRPTLIWGGRVFFWLGALLLLLNTTVLNPAVTGEEVGSLPLANLLALAYLAPALLALACTLWLRDSRPDFALACAGMALPLAFVWLTLETRHAFTGTILRGAPIGERELYSYSLVWLLFALALLAAAYFKRSPLLRWAGMLALLPAVIKVYIVDMGELTGLLRAASFLALGLSLFGIAYLNRRLGALEAAKAKPSP